MTDYNFGDVVLVPFPFTDQTTVKKRPAVVISSAVYNRERPDVIIMAVTSRFHHLGDKTGEVAIDSWQETGLIKPSLIKPIITTIENELILRTLGRLQNQDLQSLKKILAQIIG